MSAALGQRAAELHKHGGRHVCTLHGGSQSRALVSKRTLTRRERSKCELYCHGGDPPASV